MTSPAKASALTFGWTLDIEHCTLHIIELDPYSSILIPDNRNVYILNTLSHMILWRLTTPQPTWGINCRTKKNCRTRALLDDCHLFQSAHQTEISIKQKTIPRVCLLDRLALTILGLENRRHTADTFLAGIVSQYGETGLHHAALYNCGHGLPVTQSASDNEGRKD